MIVEHVFLVIASALCLAVGWRLGAKIKAKVLEVERAAGRIEGSIDVARLQERTAFCEQNVQQYRDRVSTLETSLQQTEERARSAETQCAQLRERLTPMGDLQKTLQRAESEAASASAQLTLQRGLVSGLKTQVEGATAAR